MSTEVGTILVLGLGNVLLRDDGVGVHVVRALQGLAERGELALPAGATLVDGGTLGLELLPLLSDAAAVLVVDVVDLDREPGSLAIIRGDALRDTQALRDPLDRGDVGDVIALAELMGVPPDMVSLVGVQPGEIAVGLEPTEVVDAAIPTMVDATVDELHRLAATSGSRRHDMAGATT